MKRMISVVICFAMLFSFAFAEEILNRENCEDLASLLDSENPYGGAIDQFVKDNKGKTIELDACITGFYLTDDHEIELYAGDMEDYSSDKLRIVLTDASGDDLKEVVSKYEERTGEVIDKEDPIYDGNEDWLYSTFLTGEDVRVTGVVKSYDDFRETIELTPVSIRLRTPGEEMAESPEAGPQDSKPSNEYPTLEKGSKGDEVKALQQRLIDLNYLSDTADGSFGNKTKAAVEDFQKAAGLDATGIADSETQEALYSDDAPKSTPNISCSTVAIGSNAKSIWHVGDQEFTLSGNQTKTVKTKWGTYKFDAFGNFEKLE